MPSPLYAMREECYKKEIETNIKYEGYHSMKIISKISTNSVKEATRKRHAQIILKEYAAETFKYNIGIIDLDARDAFKVKMLLTQRLNMPIAITNIE